MTTKKPVKRYSLTMDGKRWDQLTRRARSLNTSNTALINQIIQAYLDAPIGPLTSNPTQAAAESGSAGISVIGSTYTDILERLNRINADLLAIKERTTDTADTVRTSAATLEEVAGDVAVMAAAFDRHKQARQTIQRRQDHDRRQAPTTDAADTGPEAQTGTQTGTGTGYTFTAGPAPNYPAYPATSQPGDGRTYGRAFNLTQQDRERRLSEAMHRAGTLNAIGGDPDRLPANNQDRDREGGA